MPYLSFDLDAMASMPKVAAVSGTQPAVIAWGLLQLWEYAWRKKAKVVSTTHLKASFPGADIVGLVEGLCTYGFLEPVDGGFRIRGADRYLRISEARSKGGKAASANLNRGTKAAGDEPGPSPAASRLAPGLSRAQAELKPRLPPGSSASSEQSNSEHSNIHHQAVAVEKLDDVPLGQLPDTPDGFWEWVRRARRDNGLPDELRRPQGFDPWHARARQAGEIGDLCAAFTAFVRDKHFGGRGWPTALFISDGVWPSRLPARSA